MGKKVGGVQVAGATGVQKKGQWRCHLMKFSGRYLLTTKCLTLCLVLQPCRNGNECLPSVLPGSTYHLYHSVAEYRA